MPPDRGDESGTPDERRRDVDRDAVVDETLADLETVLDRHAVTLNDPLAPPQNLKLAGAELGEAYRVAAECLLDTASELAVGCLLAAAYWDMRWEYSGGRWTERGHALPSPPGPRQRTSSRRPPSFGEHVQPIEVFEERPHGRPYVVESEAAGVDVSPAPAARWGRTSVANPTDRSLVHAPVSRGVNAAVRDTHRQSAMNRSQTTREGRS